MNYFLPPWFLSFIFLVSSSIMMMSSAEVIVMAASAELSLSTIKPKSLLWVLCGWSALLYRYFWHIIAAPSSLLFCFQLFTMDTAMELTHRCYTFLSSFSALHHGNCNSTGTSLLHLLIFFFLLGHNLGT